jgi:RHS repeat-associated protein
VLDSTGAPRDQLGRVTERAESYPTARSWYYSYAPAGWLTGVGTTSGGTNVESYTYDANGNRATASDSNWSYSGATSTVMDAQDRLNTYSTSGNTKTFTYKNNGDRLTRTDSSGSTYYTYDAFGSLLSVALAGGTNTISYVVDGLGRRVGRKVNGTLVQQWIYGSQLRPVLEMDGSGNPTARFIYATHANVPDLIVTYSSGVPATVYRVLTDHLGSPRAIVPAAGGSATQTFDYDAFGNVTSEGPGYPAVTGTPSALQTFGFAGGMYDSATKLVRFGARDYEPETGRWINKDPLRFNGGSYMLYSYLDADPVNKKDATGLWTFNLGLSGGISIGPFSFSFSYGGVTDGKSAGTYKSPGLGLGGGLLPAGLFMNISAGVSTAHSIQDLNGPSDQLCGSAHILVGGTAAVYSGLQNNNRPYGGIQLGLGIGADISASGGPTFTSISNNPAPAAAPTPATAPAPEDGPMCGGNVCE